MSGETRLTIRLEDGADPIAGVLVSGSEESRFVGWIQLAGLLEAQLVGPGRGETPRATRPPAAPRGRPAAPPAS